MVDAPQVDALPNNGGALLQPNAWPQSDVACVDVDGIVVGHYYACDCDAQHFL